MPNSIHQPWFQTNAAPVDPLAAMSPIGLNASPSVRLDAVAADEMVQASGTIRVLVVEDEDQVRNVTRRVLAHSGFDVTVATNGVEALDEIRRCGGDFDVVLSDILMPEMDGVEMAVRARAEFPNIRFVFMTGFGAIVRDRSRAHELCDAILSKPFDVWEMVETVRTAASAT